MDQQVTQAAEGRWIAAPCWHNCGGRCSVKAFVKDGRIVRLKTDDTHADRWESPQMRSCPIGHALRQQIYGEDRLKFPMKRKHWEPLTGGDRSLRGRDEWVRISWDEALDYVGAGYERGKAKCGNECMFCMDMRSLEG